MRTPSSGIQYVAEPIGVVLALLPITNPTSTALFKSIVAAKTRNAIIFRPSARAAGCAVRAVEILQEAGEGAGLPPDALQVIPDPTLDVSQYLFHHDGVDLIWTTGGPKAVAAANAAGKPSLSVGAGNAPVYLHRSADVGMAVVDMLISKTFDSSVICPAEQTCVDRRGDLRRCRRPSSSASAGSMLDPDEVESLADLAFEPDGRVDARRARPVLRQPRGDGRLRGGRRRQGPAGATALRPRRRWPPPPDPGEADARPRPRPLTLGRSRGSPPASWSPSTAGSGTPRPSTPPTMR